jgi:hypothetical protein
VIRKRVLQEGRKGPGSTVLDYLNLTENVSLHLIVDLMKVLSLHKVQS